MHSITKMALRNGRMVKEDDSIINIANLLGYSEVQRATGVVALAMTVKPGVKWALNEVRIHLSAAGGAGNLTANVDHGTNSVYDFNLITQDMTSVVDLIYRPERPIEFAALDELDFAWANAGGKTYGIEVLYSIGG